MPHSTVLHECEMFVMSFPREGTGNDFFAFHPGAPGPVGQKGSKGDYGTKGLKGEPGLKGAKGESGYPGKALCHRVCGADGAFGFGTVDHRQAQAALGRVCRAHLPELNTQISLLSKGMHRVSHVCPGRYDKRHASKQMR